MVAETGLNEIVFVARSLERGGAERQLVTLAQGLSERGVRVTLILFYRGGALERYLADSNVQIVDLNKRGRWDIVGFSWRLLRVLRHHRGAVVHGYLTVPNLLLALLKPFLPSSRIVWGLRASNMDMSRYDWLSGLTYGLEKRLSNRPDLIIANSDSGKQHAQSRGYPEEKLVVIPNGIDTHNFRHSQAGRVWQREQWGIAEQHMVIGLSARLDPMKDHLTFLSAAAESLRKYPELRFVCIGDGPPIYREQLSTAAQSLGISDRMVWVGSCDDMPAAYSALDIACSASAWGEGFSNSIAEAMACSVPCVVTDVGDSARIVGSTGRVVPPRDSSALAKAIVEIATMQKPERDRLGHEARARIETEYNIDLLVERSAHALGLIPA